MKFESTTKLQIVWIISIAVMLYVVIALGTLYYDYEPFNIPNNPQTQKPYVPLYLGPRIYNSLDMHKQFAASQEQ